jgi:predicted RNA-binding protein associated with RNAse of E/G family
VDLDLDVIERFDGAVFVDDEDEFALHQVSYGYPPEVVAAAQAECARVDAELRAGAAQFAEPLASAWRSRLAGLLGA